MSKVSLTSGESCNFYAVIVDATFPYKTNKERYICSMKIADPSIHFKGGKGDQDYATLVLYAKRFEDLPIVHRIGDIIRVHRAVLRLYNHQRQFNASVFFNSSWALFSTDKKGVGEFEEADKENAPFAHSGKHCTQSKADKDKLGMMRKWAANYFSNYNVINNDMFAPLNKAASQKRDFDVVAKVVQVFEKDEYTNELKLRDNSNSTFYTLALKLKFPHVRQNDVVRIRSCTYDETSAKKVLNLQHYSNIMVFTSGAKMVKELAKVSEDRSGDKQMLKGKVMMSPVVLTEVDKKHQNMPTSTLQELFIYADQDPALVN